MYVNTGVITAIKSQYIGGLGNAGSGQPEISVNLNSGIVTSLTGYAMTMERINMKTGGDGVCSPKIYSDVGIVTNLSAGSNKSMVIDAGSTGNIKSYQFESTASFGSNVPPFVVASPQKVLNLNADLLDGMNAEANVQNAASIVARDAAGSFKGNILVANAFNGGSLSGNGGLTISNTGGGHAIDCNGTMDVSTTLTVGTKVTCPDFEGKADAAGLADDCKGAGGQVLYQASQNNTTTSSNFQFDGTKLTVANFECNGTFTAAGTAQVNAATAMKATNLSGGNAGEIPYQDGVDNTTFSSGFKLEGNTNLKVPGDITAFASDIRLKTSIQQIDNAVAKVCSLSGFTYTHNEEGKRLLGDDNRRFAGVSAQDVQAVLPEAVRPAPTDENYLTVQYEKLVPLLIEAVKELKDEIEDLKKSKVDRVYQPK